MPFACVHRKGALELQTDHGQNRAGPAELESKGSRGVEFKLNRLSFEDVSNIHVDSTKKIFGFRFRLASGFIWFHLKLELGLWC